MNAQATLGLSDLARGFPHIPAACGEALAQAAVICLEAMGHEPGVSLQAKSEFKKQAVIEWQLQLTDAMRSFWNDQEEATEIGANGIAILFMRVLAELTVLERARKGGGFDWWLGKDDNLFQEKARLEVSGILKGDRRKVGSRLAAKKKQTKQSDATGFAAYVVIVEFGTPLIIVEKR